MYRVINGTEDSFLNHVYVLKLTLQKHRYFELHFQNCSRITYHTLFGRFVWLSAHLILCRKRKIRLIHHESNHPSNRNIIHKRVSRRPAEYEEERLNL